MLTFALFFIVLFFIGAVLVTGLPVALSLQSYYQNRGRQSALCPDSGQPVDIEVDHEYAFWTALRGKEHSRLMSCSRWPEKDRKSTRLNSSHLGISYAVFCFIK